MNRPIKFRIWVKSENKMYNWQGNQDIIKDAIPYDAGDEWTEDCELMQFTGLRDKNDVDIYEGDILRCKVFEDWHDNEGHYYNHIVKFEVVESGESEIAGFVRIPKIRKVIGNIFENADLLDENARR
jgi:uncharacterized phage protein (TIGR01671 family)